MSLQAVSNVRPIRQSAAPRSWSAGRDAIRAAVKDLRQRHPRAGEQQIARFLAERLELDRDLLEGGAIYLAHDAVTAERVHRVRSAPTPKARVARKVAEKRTVQAIAAKAGEIILLDMPITLLSGEQKALRFCLGVELGQHGDAYSKLAERVGDAMVGEVLVEAEVKVLLAA